MKKTINKAIALAKLNILRFALKLSGMESDISYCDEYDFHTLDFDVWNCEDGSTVTITIGANTNCSEYEEMEFIADPHKFDWSDLLETA